jgi:YfiH family protein
MNKALWLTPDWPAPDNIQAVCTTIAFGNLATHAGEQQSVPANRIKLQKAFNLSTQPAWLNQTHSNFVTHLETHLSTPICEIADASCTAMLDQACVVLTADCLPLLMCDKAGNKIAAVHAGWRGLANGIIAKTLSYFSQPKEVLVWLGPAIGPKVFEVGQEVVDIFLALDQENKQAIRQVDRPHLINKFYIDIYQLARIQLEKLGVTHCYGGQYCTYSQSDLFYSYRRDNQAGRMASMIFKKANF